jgi:hypothetical protein
MGKCYTRPSGCKKKVVSLGNLHKKVKILRKLLENSPKNMKKVKENMGGLGKKKRFLFL